jgi:hypothetical protein
MHVHLIYNAGIGTNDQIIPIAYVEANLGNLSQLINTSGKLILEAYYNISRKEQTFEDILKMKDYIEAMHFKMQHLFCFKQRLFDCDRPNTQSLKQHMIMHLPWYTVYLGCPSNFNTSVLENMHIISKNAYKGSSRRRDGLIEEIMDTIQMAKVMKHVKSIYDDKHGTLVVSQLKAGTRKERVRRYETQECISFEVTVSSATSEELRYNDQGRCFGNISDAFLSKRLPQAALWELLHQNQDAEVSLLMRNFMTRRGDHYSQLREQYVCIKTNSS